MGTGTQGDGGARPGLGLTAEKVLELLEEVRILRERLEQSIRSNNTLAQQLRDRLNESSSGTTTSETHIHYSQSSPPQPSTRTRSSQTSRHQPEAAKSHPPPPPTFSSTEKGTTTSRVHLSEKSTSTTHLPRSHPSTSEKATATPRHHVPPTTSSQSKTSNTYRSDMTSSSARYAHHQKSRTSAPHSPIPTLSFTELDSSSTSTTRPQPSSTKVSHSGPSYHRTTTTFSAAFAPSASSTPYVHVASTATGGASPRSSGARAGVGTHHHRELTSGLHSDHLTRVTQHSCGVNTDVSQPQRSRSEEFPMPRGPGLDNSSSSSFYSHSSSTRLHDSSATAPGDPGRAWRRPASAGSSSSHRAAPQPPPHLASILYGSGDFDTLETRLQQALDSSALQVRVVHDWHFYQSTQTNYKQTYKLVIGAFDG